MFNKILDPNGYQLPRLAELGPQIGIEVQRLVALTPAQLATEVMTGAFSPQYTPGDRIVGLGTIADYFLPEYGAPRNGDTTTYQEYELRDLLAEAMQLLEHARLVRSAHGYNGGQGWVTTRAGREALAAGSVLSRVEQLAAVS